MKYYKLNLATLPDRLFDNSVAVKDWIDLATTTEGKFPTNSLNQVSKLDKEVEVERIVGISLYMIGNVLPFALPMLLLVSCIFDTGYIFLMIFLVYFGILFILNKYFFLPKFVKKYNRPKNLSDIDVRDNQYLYTERNNQSTLGFFLTF
jgi:hypothetical protein